MNGKQDGWLLGMMSGTSMDGIDAALIKSDGERITEQGPSLTFPYSAEQRETLLSSMGKADGDPDVERALTAWHAEAVAALLEKAGISADEIELIGFHGQTTFHDPANGMTCQIGDGALLAEMTGIAVVNDFRSNDMRHGGQGAPFAPLYHQALALELEKPLAVLNIGGVSNVTYLGSAGEVIACDTGPGNGLLDDWMLRHSGVAMDADGLAAAGGKVDAAALEALMDNDFFAKPLPKSLDRFDFSPAPVEGLSIEDGAATLTAFTAKAIAAVLPQLPERPKRWLVTGGGRHNPTMMAMLRDVLAAPVEAVGAVGWDGDALEAEAFAFLARRAQLGLPLSLPTTTGVRQAVTGGAVHRPKTA